MKVKGNIINTRCILITEAVTVTSTVSEEWLVRDRHIDRQIHTQTDKVWYIVKFCKVVSKKEKTEGATGLGRITREEIDRWNQMTALKFQGETSEAPGLPSGPGKSKLHIPVTYLRCQKKALPMR